jgi:hypothetical protein
LLPYFIDDPIDMRVFAVKEMPEVSLHSSCLRSNRAAKWVRCQREYRLFQSVVPAAAA